MDPAAERRALTDLERRLRREAPGLARRLAVLRLTPSRSGASWPALGGSLLLLGLDATVLVLAERLASGWLLALAVVVFPVVLVPVARSSRGSR